MKRIELKNNTSLSQIVYGMWRLGDDENQSSEHVRQKIELCLNQGITTFDQADIYGNYESEQILGTALKNNSSLRAQMEIITKCDILLMSDKYPDRKVKHYDTSATHIRNSVERSLKNMATDYIDLLLLHRPDPLMDPIETGVALDELVKSGKVKGVGVSNFKPHDWNLLQASMSSPLLTNQIELSLQAIEPFSNGDVPFHQLHHIPVMAWSPLGGGSLFKRGPTDGLSVRLNELATQHSVGTDSIAIAWLLRHPLTIMPVLGTNNLDRIGKLASACSVNMDRETWYELYTLSLGAEVP